MSLHGKIRSFLNDWKIKIDEPSYLKTIRKYKVHEWFYYGQLKMRDKYTTTIDASYFLAKKLNNDAKILETGCGPALNLIWFHQTGFKNLYGIDIEENYIEAGKEVCKSESININLWVDNCSNPQIETTEKYDAILALNWVFLDETFDLHNFLTTYKNMLNPKASAKKVRTLRKLLSSHKLCKNLI